MLIKWLEIKGKQYLTGCLMMVETDEPGNPEKAVCRMRKWNFRDEAVGLFFFLRLKDYYCLVIVSK